MQKCKKKKTTDRKEGQPKTYNVKVWSFKRLNPKIITVFVGDKETRTTEVTFPIKDPKLYVKLVRIVNHKNVRAWYPFIFTIDAEKGYFLDIVPEYIHKQNKEEKPAQEKVVYGHDK